MDIVVSILVVLMSMIVGYLISEWVHIDKENRKRKRDKDYGLNKEFYKEYPLGTNEAFEYTIIQEPCIGFDKIDDDKLDEWDINFHSTSTQGPPRSIRHLEDLLEIALKNENYEYAAQLRDRINKIKNNKNEDNIPQ